MSTGATNRTQSDSANFFNIPLSTDAQVAVERNDNREDVIIYNDSDANLLVSFTGAVSAEEYTFKILPGGYYESGITTYTGPIHLMWAASGTGKALVTELEV